MSPEFTNFAVPDLKTGEYFAICFVPDVATGAPHFPLGMMMGFTVSLVAHCRRVIGSVRDWPATDWPNPYLLRLQFHLRRCGRLIL